MKVYSPEVKVEQPKAVEIVNEQTKVVEAKFLAETENADKLQVETVKSESVGKSKTKMN